MVVSLKNWCRLWSATMIRPPVLYEKYSQDAGRMGGSFSSAFSLIFSFNHTGPKSSRRDS